MKTRRSFFKLMLAIPAVIVYGIAKPHVQNAVLNAVKDKTSGKKNSKNSFTLWQLPSQGPTQMLSYVIKSANGKVIVIDGGMTCDGAYLKKFIENLGNHVDAWFLTHPHSDHIDALTWVLLNKRDLKIDDIYASFPPLVWIKKHEKSAAHTLEKFNAAMKKSGRKYTKINRGDTFYIDGVNLEILSDVNLDIKVDARNAFQVDNNLARLDIVPHLKISGKLTDPLPNGRAEVESGTVMFQKHAFDIVKCVIDFVNPYKIEPLLDLQSQTVIGEWTIMLNISGTPDKLNFELSSDPPETDQDILSLILTGKTTNELAKGGGERVTGYRHTGG